MALKIYNPPSPYIGEIRGGLQNGMQIQISGMPCGGENRFSINLCCGRNKEQGIAFHFNPRFNQNEVVRNTSQNGCWGNEEKNGHFPFRKDCYFDMVIYVQQTCFRVYVDGKHFCDYNHRLPMNNVNHIDISNGVRLNYIMVDYPLPRGYPSEGDLAPVFNPPTPLKHRIGSLYPNRLICISGIPNPNASRFTVNFLSGSDVAFHFDVRLNQNTIVRNTCRQGQWGGEERDVPYIPFNRNLFFEMIFLVDPSCFKVAINNQHFICYNHRIQPLHSIDTLEITGDIKICQVRFK